MLQSYSLKNFKAFKELKNFPVKPITVLCGANSCGKSSFLQSLLLLKQTSASTDNTKLLVLDGKLTRLGTTENILFREDLRGQDKPSASTNQFEIDCILQGQGEHLQRYNISLESENGKTVIAKVLIEKGQGQESLTIRRVIDQTYRLSYSGHAAHHFAHINSMTSLVPDVTLYYSPSGTPPTHTFQLKRDLNTFLKQIRADLRDIFDSFTYIGPFRVPPLRRYNLNDEISEIGSQGENAPGIYEANSNKLIPNCFYCDDNSGLSQVFQRRTEITLENAVKEWLDSMHFEGLSIRKLEELFSLTVDSRSSGHAQVNICDIGFGFSQVFPIILEGLRMPKEHTLILEQPEIHLHPKLQMQLSDYFLAMALSGKRFIIETHSEHMINRLVRRIVEDKSGELKNLVGINFLTSGLEGAEVQEVKIDDSFGIVNWPRGFFDQAVDEKERTFLSSLQKRRAQHKEGN